MGTENGGQEESGGPVWGRFFDSIGGQDHDTESVMSGSHLPREVQTPPPMPSSASFSHFDSELHPDDSASVMDDDHASLHGGARLAGAISTVTSSKVHIPEDDGTYVFKFSTPSGRTHRFQARNDHYENLREIITGKLTIDPFLTQREPTAEGAVPPDPNDYHLAYTDSDGDTVYITSDSDVQDAVKLARSERVDRVVLFVHGGKTWEIAAIPATVSKIATPVEVEEKVAPAPPPPPPAPVPEEKLFGVLPKEFVLPASIGFLGFAIIAVFTISRLTSD